MNNVQAARTLANALESCVTQIQQMQGMFSDDDGAIAKALQDANDAFAFYAQAEAEEARHTAAAAPPVISEELLQSLVEKIQDVGGDGSVLDEAIHDMYSEQASAVNNSGHRAQIRALLMAGCGENEILEKIPVGLKP